MRARGWGVKFNFLLLGKYSCTIRCGMDVLLQMNGIDDWNHVVIQTMKEIRGTLRGVVNQRTILHSLVQFGCFRMCLIQTL